MKLLVTGGAGYIGSHVVSAALDAGHQVVSVDNLSTGLSSRIQVPSIQLDLASPDAAQALEAAMTEQGIEGVIHLAARKQVGESVNDPEGYYLSNIGGMANLLTAMRRAGVHKLVFSSSAATYGMPQLETIPEDIHCEPINPYGQTKLIGEWMVENARRWGLSGVSLRYFNVAGALNALLADSAALNLIPIAIEKIRAGEPVVVFGTDYPTTDGSCIRDYVHVWDLAQAHIAALDYLAKNQISHRVFNVGTGKGASVLEVLEELKRASGIDFEISIAERRPGDPPKLVADVSRIRQTLGFVAQKNLAEIVGSAWSASSES